MESLFLLYIRLQFFCLHPKMLENQEPNPMIIFIGIFKDFPAAFNPLFEAIVKR